MRYCEKCGLPETYPGIRFNEEGTCNYCEFYEAHRETIENKDERERIFDEQIAIAKRRSWRRMLLMTVLSA